MQVCIFETMNLAIPMLDIGGVLYTSNAILSEAFGIDPSTIRQTMKRNKDRFSGKTIEEITCVTECHAQDLRSVLKIKQLKKATVLWSHRDLIHLGMLLTGDTARAFQEDVIDLIESQARKNYVPREKLEESMRENTKLSALVGKLTATLEEYDSRITALEETKSHMASCAGRALSLVKK